MPSTVDALQAETAPTGRGSGEGGSKPRSRPTRVPAVYASPGRMGLSGRQPARGASQGGMRAGLYRQGRYSPCVKTAARLPPRISPSASRNRHALHDSRSGSECYGH